MSACIYSQPKTRVRKTLSATWDTPSSHYNLDTLNYNFKNNPNGIAQLYKSTLQRQLKTYDPKALPSLCNTIDVPDTRSWQAVADMVQFDLKLLYAGYTMVPPEGCLNHKQPYYEECKLRRLKLTIHLFGCHVRKVTMQQALLWLTRVQAISKTGAGNSNSEPNSEHPGYCGARTQSPDLCKLVTRGFGNGNLRLERHIKQQQIMLSLF